jgi:hypothetical protein
MMTGVKIIDAGKYLAELRASFNHSTDGHGYGRAEYPTGYNNNDMALTTINSGDQSDDHWPTINQGERDGCIVSHRIATNVLEDIETMSLNNIFCDEASESL